jgi:chromosome partitioning protein
MIVVIGGIKGGSGKTTIATNLAVMRAVHKKVLLVDADEQQSAWSWSQQRDSSSNETGVIKNSLVTVCMSGKSVYSNLLKMKSDYDDIIVDTGGRDTTSQRSALCVADKLLMPFKPSSIDIWTMGKVKSILDECINENLKSYSLISQADSVGNDNQDAIEILKEFENVIALDLMIGYRKAFRNAATNGLGVEEIHPLDKKACSEIRNLYGIIYS